LLNNINNKENNSKPEKGYSDKTSLKHAQAKKAIGKCFEKSAWTLHLVMLKRVVFF